MKESLKAISKAVTVLKCFSKNNTSLGVSDICKATGLSLGACHRIITSCVENDLLERDEKSAKYNIGPGLYLLAAPYLKSSSLTYVAEPIVRALGEISGEVVTVSLLSEENAVIILRAETRSSIRFYHHVGALQPAHATSHGKALLSELEEREVDSIFKEEHLKRYTANTITTKSLLKKELEIIRKRGVAYAIEEYQEGTVAAAAVIRGRHGGAIAALAIGTLSQLHNKIKLDKLGKLAIMGARLISYRLGYSDNGQPAPDIDYIRAWWEKHM